MLKTTNLFKSFLGYLIIIGSIVFFVGIWIVYYYSMNEANRTGNEMACQENMEQEFKGIIVNINRFEGIESMSGKFFNLHIKNKDSINSYIDYHYNLKPNLDILEFAKIGQSVIKLKGKNTFTVIDASGNEKSFKIAKCATIE